MTAKINYKVLKDFTIGRKKRAKDYKKGDTWRKPDGWKFVIDPLVENGKLFLEPLPLGDDEEEKDQAYRRNILPVK